MLFLTIWSACVVILALPASVAPLPLETSELQRPTGNLALPPEQALAADNLAASRGAAQAPGSTLRVYRTCDVGFRREADYAVSAATAIQTVIPAQNTKATPAALAAAAPTRVLFARQSTCVTVSPPGNCQPVPDAPLILLENGDKYLVYIYELGPGTDPLIALLLLDPDVFSLSNDALATPRAQPPPTTADAPRPNSDARARAIEDKANPTPTQNRLDDAPTSTKKSEPTLKAQLDTANRTVSISKLVGSPVTVVMHPDSGSDTDSEPASSAATPAAVPHKVHTVAAESHSQHDRRRRRRRRLPATRTLSRSSMYPDSGPNPQPINPRAIGPLPVAEPTPGAALVKPSKRDTDVMRRMVQPSVSVNPGVRVFGTSVGIYSGSSDSDSNRKAF